MLQPQGGQSEPSDASDKLVGIFGKNRNGKRHLCPMSPYFPLFAAEGFIWWMMTRTPKLNPICQINGMVLRKHFYQLTQLFLMPFEHYFEFDTKKAST